MQTPPQNIYMISVIPYYDSKQQTYIHIIIIDKSPPQTDSLSSIVKLLSTPKLSPFKQDYEGCVYAIYDPDYPNELLTLKKMSTLFKFLITNNYKINKTLTKIVTDPKNRHGPNNDILCFIQK
jgi:hypothetical protein